jgi:hypothetical protein
MVFLVANWGRCNSKVQGDLEWTLKYGTVEMVVSTQFKLQNWNTLTSLQ